MSTFKFDKLWTVLAGFLLIAWSSAAYSFFTVHRIGNVNLEIHFQSGLSDISTEVVHKQDILEELSVGRPGSDDILAAVIDCNNPGSVHLVVWNKKTESIVDGSSMVSLQAIDTVMERKKKKDYLITLLDAEALFGAGYITARIKLGKIKDKYIPAEATPEDQTYCVKRFKGLSAAGYVDGESFGIVSGGRINFGKPMATINDFAPF